MSITWRTAHTRVVFVARVSSLEPFRRESSRRVFRGALWRMEKPEIRSRVLDERPGVRSSVGHADLAEISCARRALATRSRRNEHVARSNNRRRAIVAAFVSVAFLWALALGASPQLHQRVHAEANRVEHSCAVTMIASGSYDHGTHPPLISAAILVPQFSKISALTPCWVQSPFLGACIFEHAPPAYS